MGTTTVKQKVILPASPEVYEAFTDPKKLSEFMGSEATGNPVIGGEFTAYAKSILGTCLWLEDGKHIVQTLEQHFLRLRFLYVIVIFQQSARRNRAYNDALGRPARIRYVSTCSTPNVQRS